jgi:hypothetical protein
MVKLIFIVVILTPVILISQSDSLQYDANKLILNPRFSGVQIEATTLLLINEFGALVDFDLYSSQNKHYNLGVRFSLEYYDLFNLDFGGGGSDESHFNYNFYARHTIKGSFFWFSFLLGASIQKFSDDFRTETNFVPRAGFELRYNLTDYEIALLFKGAKSFLEEAGYLGLGISFGFHRL